jgi:predicted O-methyltransferase YrrM
MVKEFFMRFFYPFKFPHRRCSRYQTQLKRSLLNVANATTIFPKIYETQVELSCAGWRYGHILNSRKLLFLCSLVSFLNIRKIFEFGTFTGRTTRQLAVNLPDDGVIHTLDTGRDDDSSHFDMKKYGDYVVGEDYCQAPDKICRKIIQHLGDSKSFDFEKWRGTMEFVFIDGGHDYQTVLSDSRNAFKMVAKGGIIVWDDYGDCWPGVKRAVDELSGNFPLYLLQEEGVVLFRQGDDFKNKCMKGRLT